MNRVETVDYILQLAAHAEVINRRCEHDHVRLHQLVAYSPEVIFLHARAIHLTHAATQTTAHALPRIVEFIHFVACLSCSSLKGFGKQVGISAFTRTAFQNYYLHLFQVLYL